MTIFPKRKPSLYEVKDYDDFRAMLEDAVRTSGDTIAVKYKKNNSSHDVTYNELLSIVNALGTGLTSLPGEEKRVAVVCPNGFHFIAVMMCALCSNGVFIPVDAALPFVEIVNILNHSDCDTLFIDKSFLPAYLESRKNLPKIKSAVCFSLKEHEEKEGVYSYSGVIERGQTALAGSNESYLSLKPAGNAVRLLFYKSGSTDSLRGVMLTQDAVMSAVKGFLQLTSLEGRGLSVMPFNRPFELVCDLLASFYSCATVCINNSLKNFQKDLTSYSPEYMFLPPLYVENIWQKLVKTIETQGRTDTFNTLVRTSSALRKIGIDRRRTFFEKIHEGLGGKLSKIYVGGATINPEAVKYFDNIGVTVLGGYGLTECCSIVSQNREDQNDPSSAGILLPCMKAMISDANEQGEGEICVAGGNLTVGYYKNERATAAAIDPAGWLHTGDIGRISSSGQLFITGKLKNEIVLKSGRCVLPEEIESYLLALPFAAKAKVYAGKDASGAELHLCADLTLKKDFFGDLPKEERNARVKEKLDALNAELPPFKRVKVVHIKQQEDRDEPENQ